MKSIKRNLILFTTTLFVVLVTLSSCGKKGCTDSNATNYCDECKKDDGSCTYKATIQFWHNQSTANNLINDTPPSTSLKYYVDGSLIGSAAASVYYTGDPNCTQNGVVRVTKDLGKDKTKSATYKVVDDLGITIWEGNVTFDATKSCTSIQLTY
jgi:hypothetical protein